MSSTETSTAKDEKAITIRLEPCVAMNVSFSISLFSWVEPEQRNLDSPSSNKFDERYGVLCAIEQLNVL